MRARAMYERHGWRRMSTSYKTMTDAELASACKRLQDLANALQSQARWVQSDADRVRKEIKRRKRARASAAVAE
jgi:hypothetical protein